QLVAAWAAGGYWQANPRTDLAPPSGGVYGNSALINVDRGELYGANAVAIDGFSTTPQHTAPGSDAPDLNTTSKSANGLVAAFVDVDGRALELDYANAVDAISALLMTDVLVNGFNIDPAMGAGSDWIVTAPTKRFYVDPKYVGMTQAVPFSRGNAAKPPFE